MSAENQPPVSACPAAETWLEALCDREDPDALGRQPELQVHLEHCAACRTTVDEVRRYQTMLLRARVPGLSGEQRQSLEDRVRMAAGQWVPPPRMSPRVVWGVALAAAAVLVAVLARPYVSRRAENLELWNHRVAESYLPSVDKPGVGVLTGAVEGGVEVTDAKGTWRALRPGEALRAGARMRSMAHGRVVVPGRFELRLEPDAELEVLATSPVDDGHAGDAAFRLRSGQVDCTVEKLRPAQRFVVMFAGFRASVVGTRFTVQHTSSSAGVQVQVAEGAVRVDQADDWWKAPNGDTMTTVRAGNRWHYDAGRMALEPIPMPAAQQPAAVQQPKPVAVPAVESPAPVADPAQEPAQVEDAAAHRTTAAHPAAKAAAPTQKAQPAAGSGTTPERSRAYIIEVPPQTMSPEEGLR